MKLSSDVFWRLTPAQFSALSRRLEITLDHHFLGFGIVSAVIANVHRDAKKKPDEFLPTDFVPLRRKEPKPKKSSEELHAIWKGLFRIEQGKAPSSAGKVEPGVAGET